MLHGIIAGNPHRISPLGRETNDIGEREGYSLTGQERAYGPADERKGYAQKEKSRGVTGATTLDPELLALCGERDRIGGAINYEAMARDLKELKNSNKRTSAT